MVDNLYTAIWINHSSLDERNLLHATLRLSKLEFSEIDASSFISTVKPCIFLKAISEIKNVSSLQSETLNNTNKKIRPLRS